MRLPKCSHYHFLILKRVYQETINIMLHFTDNKTEVRAVKRTAQCYREAVAEPAFGAFLTLCIPVTSAKQRIHPGFLRKNSPQERPCDAGDRKYRDLTWIHQLAQWRARSFNFLRLLSFPDIQWAYNHGYLRSKSCHEAQTQESETLPGFRWLESLSYSVQTFIRCYDTATSSYRVDEFWGLLHPVLIFRV